MWIEAANHLWYGHLRLYKIPIVGTFSDNARDAINHTEST